MKIISGNANKPLADFIAEDLGTSLVASTIKSFSDCEVSVEFEENIRGKNCFVVQPTSNPANDHLMELLIAVDALKRSSARCITAVILYYGYARQDRKSGPRTPISAKLIANLLTTAGVTRVITVDLHADQIQGFFDIPVDNLTALPLFGRDIHQRHQAGTWAGKLCIVSPDVGGVVRARKMGTYLHEAYGIETTLAIIDKRSPKANVSEVMNIIGDVEGYSCIMVDDLVDTVGTLCNAAKALMENGAVSVDSYCSHGVLSGAAYERIKDSCLGSLTVTNSIEPSLNNADGKIRHLNLSPLLSTALHRTESGESVSVLFKPSAADKLPVELHADRSSRTQAYGDEQRFLAHTAF